MAKPGHSVSNEPVYRAIMTVMVASVMAGAILAIAGEYHFRSEAMKQVGVAAALVSGAVYFVFRLLGRREAARLDAARRSQLLRGEDDD